MTRELVSKSRVKKLLTTCLATPLGMKDTTITLTPAQHARFPRCHNTKGKETPPWEFGCLEGFGAIRSTVKDMLRFTEANLDRQSMTLGPAFGLSHDKWREIGDQDPYVEYIGFCWTHAKTAKAERHMIWHNGATYGSCSFLGFMPKSGVGLVILSNSGHDLDALGFQLLEKLGKER